MSTEASNPWAATEATESSDEASNPWATTESSDASSEGANPWGSAADQGSNTFSMSAEKEEFAISWSEPFQHEWIPLETWVEQGISWIVENFRPFFSAIKAPVDATLTAVEAALQGVPALIMIVIISMLAWQMAGKRLGLATLCSLFFLGAIGAWQEAMTTLSLVLTSVFFCMLIGIPSGICMARSDRAQRFIRPMLDAMQTTPAFVYLVPIVMLFGIGNVPGVVVTIIFAVPPVIRLTNLGIRQVPEDLIEAAHSFGASGKQLLFKVQLPLAMPTIMAGVNQTLMLSLSMVVIASMISVGGLGLMVLRGIGRLDIGLATVGGIGIVILAIILDRMTQSLGQSARERGTRHWYETGPVGLLLKIKN